MIVGFPRSGKWSLAPVERLLLGAYVFLLALAMNPRAPTLTVGSHLAVGLVVLLAGTVVLDPAAGNLQRWLRELLPIPLLLNIFQNLGAVIESLRGRTSDSLLIACDRRLLGAHLYTALWTEHPSWPITDLLTLGYTSFYFLPLALFLWMVWTRHPRRQFVITAFAATFFVSYVGYFLMPALGPRLTLATSYYRNLPAGIIGGHIRHLLDALERTKTDAFPSGHTMVTLVALFFVARYRRSWLVLYVPCAALLIAATVLLGYHYVTDVLVGMALTPLGPYLALRLFPRLSESGAPAPELSAYPAATSPAASTAPSRPAQRAR
jgi:membrane-associated phospholipid phosphatase